MNRVERVGRDDWDKINIVKRLYPNPLNLFTQVGEYTEYGGGYVTFGILLVIFSGACARVPFGLLRTV